MGDELKQRILSLSPQEELFTGEYAAQIPRDTPVLPGCLPMANAALEADPELRNLRFRLVPQRLSEECFWRCYFYHVANIKCELCNDFVTANRARREAACALEQDAIEASKKILDGVELSRDVEADF